MSFKVICNKCGNPGEIYQFKSDNPFSTLARIKGEFSVEYGDKEGYDHIKVECKKCGNKVEG